MFIDDVGHILNLCHFVGSEINDIAFHTEGEAIPTRYSVKKVILGDAVVFILVWGGTVLKWMGITPGLF